MPREIHFVNLSHPADSVSAESRRVAHAHAARTAHARRDRFRIVRYPAGTRGQKIEKEKGSAPKNNKPASSSSVCSKVAYDASSMPILKTVLASNRRDPFDSLAKSFTEFQYFLFDYCLLLIYCFPCFLIVATHLTLLLDTQIVIPDQSVSCNRLLSPEKYCQLMKEELTRLLITRGDSLDSLFLITCRHLTETKSGQPEEMGHYTQLALQYKVSCLKSLNEAISSEVENVSIISDSTLVTAMMLASDEVSTKQFTRLGFKY